MDLTKQLYNCLRKQLLQEDLFMKKVWYRPAAAALAAAVLCTQGISASAQPGVQNGGEVFVEYLTIQPGATTASVNLNWYAPD